MQDYTYIEITQIHKNVSSCLLALLLSLLANDTSHILKPSYNNLIMEATDSQHFYSPCVCVCLCIVCVCVCLCIVCVFVYCVCVFVYCVCMYVCACVCLCIVCGCVCVPLPTCKYIAIYVHT